MLLCSGNLHTARLVNPKRILDIGTGTGIWAIEMAEQYPDAQVIGTDLSPIQPQWYEKTLLFRNWASLVRKAYRHTKPGGYFELQELDPRFTSNDSTLSPTSNLVYWSKIIIEAAANYNRPIPRYTDYFSWFERAGFVDIQQVLLKCPMNPWPKNKVLKEAGRFQLLAHIDGLEGVSLGLLTRGLDWKAEEVKVLMAKIRPELKNRAIHSYQTKCVHFRLSPPPPAVYILPPIPIFSIQDFANHGTRVFIVGRKPERPRTNTQSTNTNNPRSCRHLSTAPPTPTSFSSSAVGSPAVMHEDGEGSPPPDQINAFTPTMPLKKEVIDASRRGI
ncbi:MAG: hypothetical protein LQ343_005005 [Gyalolechia ehrenbergii]|nr:MAG: hypothetical protein LQ343_005005 [Gyalolechia ehrenbergii]